MNKHQTGEIPSIGRIVHYVFNGQCHAAMVIDDHGDGDTITLKVMFRDGHESTLTNIPYNGDRAPYTWHWPERVP